MKSILGRIQSLLQVPARHLKDLVIAVLAVAAAGGLAWGAATNFGAINVTGTATFTGPVQMNNAKSKGSCTLGTSCAGITVTSGSKCWCADTVGSYACSPPVSGTSLTITGNGTDTINWGCQ